MVGFIDGYLTMDSLGVLAFTLVLSNTVKQRGITKPTTAIKSSLYASAIASALIGIIYFFLIWMGNHTSVTSIPDGQNIGTHLLVRASQDGFSALGVLILGSTVLLASITTSTGVVSAVSSYFHANFPKISYRNFVFIIISFIFRQHLLSKTFSYYIKKHLLP